MAVGDGIEGQVRPWYQLSGKEIRLPNIKWVEFTGHATLPGVWAQKTMQVCPGLAGIPLIGSEGRQRWIGCYGYNYSGLRTPILTGCLGLGGSVWDPNGVPSNPVERLGMFGGLTGRAAYLVGWTKRLRRP
jgi:hypothetical protein